MGLRFTSGGVPGVAVPRPACTKAAAVTAAADVLAAPGVRRTPASRVRIPTASVGASLASASRTTRARAPSAAAAARPPSRRQNAVTAAGSTAAKFRIVRQDPAEEPAGEPAQLPERIAGERLRDRKEPGGANTPQLVRQRAVHGFEERQTNAEQRSDPGRDQPLAGQVGRIGERCQSVA